MFSSKKILAATMFSAISCTAFADGLDLPGETYLWGAEGVKCEPFGENVETPATLTDLGIEIGEITTNETQLAAKIASDFVEGDAVCTYEALYRVNIFLGVITQYDSAAYSLDGTGDCSVGKAKLDSYFASGSFERWGDGPYHLTIFVNTDEAASICGPGATKVGFDFVYVGEL
jgi:hypothetical protein